MDSPGKLFTLKNLVQAPINKKPEKEDGFPTPEGEPFSLQLYVKKNQENQVLICLWRKESFNFTF